MPSPHEPPSGRNQIEGAFARPVYSAWILPIAQDYALDGAARLDPRKANAAQDAFRTSPSQLKEALVVVCEITWRSKGKE